MVFLKAESENWQLEDFQQAEFSCVSVKRFLLSIRKSVTENFVDWKLPPLFVFSMHFFILGLIKKCIVWLFLGVDPIFFSH